MGYANSCKLCVVSPMLSARFQKRRAQSRKPRSDRQNTSLRDHDVDQHNRRETLNHCHDLSLAALPACVPVKSCLQQRGPRRYLAEEAVPHPLSTQCVPRTRHTSKTASHILKQRSSNGGPEILNVLSLYKFLEFWVKDPRVNEERVELGMVRTPGKARALVFYMF